MSTAESKINKILIYPNKKLINIIVETSMEIINIQSQYYMMIMKKNW